MAAMTFKVNGLFSIGEDFDDEDLLDTDWTVSSASDPAPTSTPVAVSPGVLRAPSVTHREPERKPSLQRSAQGSAAPCNGSASRSVAHDAAAAPTALSASSSSSRSPCSELTNNAHPNIAAPQGHVNTKGPLKPCVAQDDFDDWDVDWADLSECDGQMVQTLRPPHPPPPSTPPAPTVQPPSSAKALRPPSCGRIQTPAAGQPCGSSNHNLPLRAFSAAHARPPVPRPAFSPAPPRSPGVFPGPRVNTPPTTPVSRTFSRPQQPQRQWSTPGPSPQRQWSTPGPSPQPRGLFQSVSPAPSSSSILSPHSIHTPVLTNRLVQLVSASSKHPRKRPRSEPQRPRTRRFPGPAGLLPEQPQGQSLDDVVVSVPQTPAHGVMARLSNQVSASQAEEEEFSGGAWAAMKTEMGLDERNPSCFLHSYSVVMVLRKAALKQLTRNKVPNMAVLLKSIVYTQSDAKVVFKDPTGEIQGTVHRRLLEDRAEELKVGVVLLLKQVGVFSPSHRNHYLNVTSNNLLRIYTSAGAGLSSTPLPPLVLEQTSPDQSRSICREPLSRMHLAFDEEDGEGREGERCPDGGEDLQAPAGAGVVSSRGPRESAGCPAAQDTSWDADDDLDELLGELPEDTYSL